MNISNLHSLESFLIVIACAVLCLILWLWTIDGYYINLNQTYMAFGTLASCYTFSLYAASNFDLTSYATENGLADIALRRLIFKQLFFSIFVNLFIIYYI
jgi:hypothetical protein